MPLYDYQCVACKKTTEVRHGFGEHITEKCPSCGGELKRVFNPAPIVFKGSGFYINDSRPKSGASSGESPSSANGNSSSSESGGNGSSAVAGGGDGT